MLALTPHLRIFLAFDPIDFRCGMNRNVPALLGQR
jgi:hypothetical protein